MNTPFFKSHFVTSLLLSFVLIFICIVSLFSCKGHAADTNVDLFGNKNGFLLCGGSPVTVYFIDKKGISQKVMTETFDYKSGLINDTSFFIFCQNNFQNNGQIEYDAVMLICDNRGVFKDYINFYDIDIKKDCAVYDVTNQKSYFVDERSSNTIKVFNSNGICENSFSVEKDIQRLFIYNTSEIYAITSDGVYFVGNSEISKIGILYPKASFRFYDSFCCDSEGNIFTFNNQNGFSFYCNTNCQCTAIMQNKIYALYKNKIYRLNTKGEKLAEYTADSEITDLCAGGSSLAFESDGNIHVIDANAFIKIDSSSSSTPSLDAPSTSSNSDENSTQSVALYSDVYDLNKSIIEIPLGKTVAKFKKEIISTGYAISFYNHNQIEKTSGSLGTGWTVSFSSNSAKYTYTFLVKGDLTGEGNINTRDTYTLANCLTNADTLSLLQFDAADINLDGIVDTADFLLLYKQIG